MYALQNNENIIGADINTDVLDISLQKYENIKTISNTLLHRCGFMGKRQLNLLCPDQEKNMQMSFYIASAGEIKNIRELDDNKPLGGYSLEMLEKIEWYCNTLIELWNLTNNPLARSSFVSFINGNYTPEEAIELMSENGLREIIKSALSGVPIEDILV